MAGLPEFAENLAQSASYLLAASSRSPQLMQQTLSANQQRRENINEDNIKAFGQELFSEGTMPDENKIAQTASKYKLSPDVVMKVMQNFMQFKQLQKKELEPTYTMMPDNAGWVERNQPSGLQGVNYGIPHFMTKGQIPTTPMHKMTDKGIVKLPAVPYNEVEAYQKQGFNIGEFDITKPMKSQAQIDAEFELKKKETESDIGYKKAQIGHLGKEDKKEQNKEMQLGLDAIKKDLEILNKAANVEKTKLNAFEKQYKSIMDANDSTVTDKQTLAILEGLLMNIRTSEQRLTKITEDMQALRGRIPAQTTPQSAPSNKSAMPQATSSDAAMREFLKQLK